MARIVVTMQHVRAAKLGGVGVLCAPGIRAWCEQHGVDLRQLVEEGLPIEQAEQIDNAFAQRACAIARAEAEAASNG
ncbi:hypothetical protein [Rhodanobacter denitrificans]|uniref:Uncharacterized protein n=1 Tax=Rhodanobacter denitrificans TaxID=666685 RepID=M4NGB5_9GAMM|nr:hypothetical protein [Rhodanobacter denitrificans]AGG89939.1 hypothetical protein R2APBS1_2862 [Rhodanobacter denitrificans]UJM85334.1 hypothetical protein LRJ86_11140 [Rhodanobacter denitrificans]